MTAESSAEAKRRERKRVKVKRERKGLREPIGGLRERSKMEMELKWWVVRNLVVS